MGRLRFCSNIVVLVFLISLLSSETTLTQGFESHLELPTDGSTNTRPGFKWVLSISDFGAVGDGISDDTRAFISAWNTACHCSSTAAKTIVIPSKRAYLVHPLNLHGPCASNITLRIYGTIVAPRDPEAWSGFNRRKWLYIYNVNHLTITGGGTIDGMGNEWWSRSCKTNYSNPCRPAPTAITFHRCKDLKVRNLMLLNSQQMHMAFTNCKRVSASHLKFIAPSSSPNTDGVHISSSSRIEVKDSIFMTGDDCVSIVGNSTRIRIRRIECGPGHGISIGSLGKSNSLSQIRDVIVNEAFLSNTDNGVRIKTWQGGSGFVSKVTFQNLSMENVSNPIIINQYYCDSQKPCQNQTSAVKVKDIAFIHIHGSSATEQAITFSCSDSEPCEGIYLEDIELVSSTEGTTRSSCWEAYGASSGLVHPSACSFPTTEGFLIQKHGLSDNSLLLSS